MIDLFNKQNKGQSIFFHYYISEVSVHKTGFAINPKVRTCLLIGVLRFMRLSTNSS